MKRPGVSPRERIGRVAERWFLVEPLLFAAWNTHRVQPDPRVETVRIAHGEVAYNPAFVESLTDPQLHAVLKAEATRILLKHPYSRRKPATNLAWTASNVTLAELLRDPLLPFPSARQLFGDPELDQRYFELYYDALLRRGGAPAGAGAGTGATAEGGGGPGEAALGAYANAADGATGWEEDELYQDAVDDRIRSALESGRWGTVAGRLREQVVASLTPRLDYREVLRRFRASVITARTALTRMKPSRRYGFDYLGRRHELATRLLVALDVSGSMGHEDLATGLAIVNRFFRYGMETIDVVQFDAQIHGKPLTLRHARREMKVLGRGGTDFAPVMAHLDEHPDYDGLIVFTDGVAPVPPRPRNRRTRVLWLFTNERAWAAQHAGLAAIGQSAWVRG